jgi:protein SCO1/2
MNQVSHQRAARRGALLTVAMGVAILVTAATWAAFRWGVEPQPPLPVLGGVPSFTLVGSDGQPVAETSLAGTVWVADFIFTQCPGMCPVLSAQMARVQKALGPDSRVRLVSFSVDPANDSPEVLRAYGTRFGADPQRWLFLTGKRDDLFRVIQDGFRLAVAERSEAEATDGEGLITHSDRFVLVDRSLQIRGYYHGMDDADVERLLQDIDRLEHGNS